MSALERSSSGSASEHEATAAQVDELRAACHDLANKLEALRLRVDLARSAPSASSRHLDAIRRLVSLARSLLARIDEIARLAAEAQPARARPLTTRSTPP